MVGARTRRPVVKVRRISWLAIRITTIGLWLIVVVPPLIAATGEQAEARRVHFVFVVAVLGAVLMTAISIITWVVSRRRRVVSELRSDAWVSDCRREAPMMDALRRIDDSGRFDGTLGIDDLLHTDCQRSKGRILAGRGEGTIRRRRTPAVRCCPIRSDFDAHSNRPLASLCRGFQGRTRNQCSDTDPVGMGRVARKGVIMALCGLVAGPRKTAGSASHKRTSRRVRFIR